MTNQMEYYFAGFIALLLVLAVVFLALIILRPLIPLVSKQTRNIPAQPKPKITQTGKGVKLITVHGTFAGDEADEGEKWWQRHSPFLNELQEYIEEPLHVEPFHWSGANSEMDRRRAGCELGKAVLDSPNDPIIIGHSHGGSVGIQALLWKILRRGEQAHKRLRGFVTIGTPMIRFNADANPFTRFNILGRILFLSVVISILLISIQTFSMPVSAPDFTILERLGFIILSHEFLLVMIVSGILLAYSLRNFRRRQLFSQNRIFEVFHSRACSFSHSQDEAINALQRAKKVKPELVKFSTVFAGVFSVVSLGLILADTIDDIWSAVARDDHYYSNENSLTHQQAFVTSENISVFYIKYAGSEWNRRLYDITAPRLRTRAALKAVPLAEIWQAAPLDKLLSEDGTPWLRQLKNQVPADTGYVFLSPDDELVFYTTYAERLRGIKDEVGTSKANELLQSGILDFGFTASTPDLLEYAPNTDSTDWPALPPAIVAYVPHDQIQARLSNGILPANTRFLMSRGTQRSFQICTDQLVWEEAPQWSLYMCDMFFLEKAHFVKDVLLNGTSINSTISNISATLIIETASSLFAESNEDIPDAIIVFFLVLEFIFRLFLIISVAVLGAALVSFLLQPLLSKFLIQTLHNTAYGNDGHGEKVKDVSPGIDFTSNTAGTLPDNVEKEMIDNSLHDAPRAIQKLRMIFSDAEYLETNSDMLSMATKFEKSELIHNAYFHSSLFIKYLAAQMIEKFDLTPSEKFKADQEAMAFKYTV